MLWHCHQWECQSQSLRLRNILFRKPRALGGHDLSLTASNSLPRGSYSQPGASYKNTLRIVV
jgi:hypothetical protein